MKIAFLSFYSGCVARGVETFVHEVASRLATSHEVTVYQSGPLPPGASYMGKRVAGHFDGKKQERSGAIREFTQRVLPGLVDVDVVFPTNGRWQSFFCRLWSYHNGARMVISGQSGPGLDDRLNILSRPDVFVALTDFQKEWAKNNGFGVRVEKIPNGVDPDKFCPRGLTAKLGLPRPVVLCPAALEAGKRVDLTIRAVASLGKGSLVVLGEGEDEKALTALAEELIPKRYLFTCVSHEEMPRFFRAADVVSYAPVPSESFGIVLLEAMACDRPVVVPDDPVRREIVGRAGVFVDPADSDGYAAGLKKAWQTKWGDIPRGQAAKFSWEGVGAKYDDLLRSLVR